jgi:hypothetical protein
MPGFGAPEITAAICCFVGAYKHDIVVGKVSATRDFVVRVGAHPLRIAQQLVKMSASARGMNPLPEPRSQAPRQTNSPILLANFFLPEASYCSALFRRT